MIGKTLSHFKITAKLGEGGMGEVYRAEDTTLDREVALKVLPAALAEDPDRLARFEREAKTLAALDHPNIVHIYSVESATVEAGLDPAQEGDESGPHTIRFLTMQLVEGQSLAEMIPADGLPLERIFELTIPLAEALAAMTEARLPAIVVLPFQNRGASEDEYFADGMSEEITTRLAGVSGLRVVSSTSAMQYKENRPPLKQIAEELSVDYVLDGSVRWARGEDGSRVRITPQLVRISDDTQVWAESYDRVLEDVFEMQSEIASEVVAQFGVTLLEPEREELETQPTENLEAYQAYMRGNYGLNSSDYTEPTRRQIIEDLQTAVDLDPGFALAWASLAHAHAFYYRLGYDFTEARRAMASEAYDRALNLDSVSSEVLHETGYYHYYVEQDFEAALSKFLAASEANPNDSEIIASAAYVWRRQGKLDKALDQIDLLLSIPAKFSVTLLRIDPRWDGLRDHPRYRELLEKYS